ncbi:histone-lysine N-methyltransferase SETD2 [Trichonephila clavata]|uniref:[histone H3]-lysine(36) N-trimethyltransferase n=1 Tax=Trichonephila clavata TaxID=2740835 RepID=A0A8X6KRG3_TRICU|nr:histone-lysine N-methyltransferase SETD2 [Trichonephila clavata]
MANKSNSFHHIENLVKMESAMKPEKVKSRWRRSSEMEIGEKSTLCPKDLEKEAIPTNFEEPNATLTLDKKESIPEYVALQENMYLFERKRTKRKKEVRRLLCECTLSKEDRENGVPGCQDECLNRLLMIECGSRCATGEACSNKRFQKRLYAKVEPFKTQKKGWGLKILEDVPMGNFVIEYVGEVLNRIDFKQRVKQYAREKSNHYYFMALKTDEIIDATNKGNLSRFMNHSCDPNCETQKWTVNGELRIGFFARRDLKAGEELTFDYQFQRYGREAQKCFCESELCSGYIGVSKEISLDVTNKTINKRKKGSEEKKRDVLEDLILEEEIEKLCENGGLRNKDDTLILSRLMVRAEDFHSRYRLLEIILGTSEIGYLRLFLDYHGLSLLWSWMVDLTEPKLKMKILQVLSFLPVPNKTMLLESKVYNVVERWASNILATESHGDLQNLNEISNEKNFSSIMKKMKASDTSDSETDGIVSQSESINVTTSRQDEVSTNRSHGFVVNQYLEDGSVSSTITSDIEENGGRIPDVLSRSDEESGDATDLNKCNDSELSIFANNLLLCWKDLKEDFRIPRREHQKCKDKTICRHGKDEVCKHCSNSGSMFGRNKIPVIANSRKERSRESFHIQEKVWGRRNSASEDKPRKVLLPTPVVLTKEERRLLFERKVRENDQKKALNKKQKFSEPSTLIDSTNNVLQNTNSDFSFISSESNYCNPKSECYSFPAPENTAVPFDQYYYNTNELQLGRPPLLPTPGPTSNTLNPESLPATNPLNPGPLPITSNALNPGPLPLTSNALNPGPLPITNNALNPGSLPITSTIVNPGTLPMIENSNTIYSPNVYRSSHLQVPVLGPPPVSQSSNNLAPCQNSPAAPSTNLMAVNSSPIVPTLPAINAEANISTSKETVQSTLYTGIQNSACVSGPTNFSTSGLFSPYGAGQNPYAVNPNNRYYAQQQVTISVSEQISIEPTCSNNNTNDSEAIPKTPSVKLPPNWKTATDTKGNIYYYHMLTRQTQWHAPSFDVKTEDIDDDIPTYDEIPPKENKQIEKRSRRSHRKHSKKRSTTTAAADTSSSINTEIAKKIKELFRTKMSSFVVQCLNPYHREDCRVGKITSSEDFKYLARKLTHFVMTKELKHCKMVEDLECNDSVKFKARDFIHKYMSKFGPLYKKERCDSPINF